MFNFFFNQNTKKELIVTHDDIKKSKIFTYENLYNAGHKYSFGFTAIMKDNEYYAKIFSRNDDICIILLTDFIDYLQKNLGKNFIVQEEPKYNHSSDKHIEIFFVM